MYFVLFHLHGVFIIVFIAMIAVHAVVDIIAINTCYHC